MTSGITAPSYTPVEHSAHEASKTTFDKINFRYSLKNIPIPQNHQYMRCLVDKLNSFIRRLRWKAFYYNKAESEQVKNYGFKSEKWPPQISELSEFEADLYNMARSFEFKRVGKSFQAQLARDVNNINASSSVYVSADKTNNIYKMEIENYDKMLRDNIKANYKKTETATISHINMEAKYITEKFKLADRVEQCPRNQAFITIKGHKPNFPNNSKWRLINPAKSNLGRISSQLLKEINVNIRKKPSLQQWRNTAAVMSWFKNFP